MAQAAKERKIHISLDEGTHQRLRVKCALEGTTMQEFVSRLVADAVREVEIQGTRPRATSKSRERSHGFSEKAEKTRAPQPSRTS